MIIYGLADPRNGQLRYIGATKRRLSVRLNAHINKRFVVLDRPLNVWLRELFDLGLRPEPFAIERSGDAWEEDEAFWIGYFRFVGADLLNLSAGGVGNRCGSPRPEAKARTVSAVVAARKHWAASRTHCRHGHPFTPENTLRTPGRTRCRTCKRLQT